MAAHREIRNQYISLENAMRSKYATDFPESDVNTFNTAFFGDRARVDNKGKTYRSSYDERRWISEGLTWLRFWPEEDFPGIKPPSTGKNAEKFAIAMRNDTPNQVQRGGYRARGYQHYRGRGSVMSPTRESIYSGRGRPSYNYSNVYGSPQQHITLKPSSHSQQLSHEDNCELINFNDGATSSQNYSSLITDDKPGTQVSRSEDISLHTIVCRQCGVAGHPEMDCSCEIVIKQGKDRERHLVCGTPGHRAFRFDSHTGCLECKNEQKQANSNKKKEEETAESLEATPVQATHNNLKIAALTPTKTLASVPSILKTAAVTAPLKTTSLGQIKLASPTCGTKVTDGAYGWEENDYNEAIRRRMSRSSDDPVGVIANNIKTHNLEAYRQVEFEKDDQESDDNIKEEDEEFDGYLIRF